MSEHLSNDRSPSEMPAAEGATPVAEGAAPVAEEAAPVAGEAVPVAEEAAPVAGEAVPVAEGAAPVAGEAVPVAEEAAPVAEAAAPGAEEAAPGAEEAALPGTVVPGSCPDLHIGDYVGFQRMAPVKEWKLSLGKVVSFPLSRTVKVVLFDAVNEATVARDPISEAAVRQKAEEDNKMDIWHNREALREELAQVCAKESVATRRLFAARDKTAELQTTNCDRLAETLENLDKARQVLREVPQTEWADLRSSFLPTPEVFGVMRSVMLILYEDSVTTWEEIQAVVCLPDFFERVMSWDCTVTPMSLTRRRRITVMCTGKDVEGPYSAKKRRRSRTRSPAPAGPLSVAATSSNARNLATLDKCLRAWINAQITCSEVARQQEIAVNKCFAEQQEQRVLLREINDMRLGISSIEVQMLEMKNAILGIDDSPKPIMPLEAYPIDTVFHKRTYSSAEGRYVQELILRDAVVINFGPITEEDEEGYVRLSTTQVDCLRNAVMNANIRHDAEEMEELLARKEREEKEIAELKDRIEQLRNKPMLTAEEEEELMQLEKLLADAERRHHATLSRIADLYACGRGAREITLAIKRPNFCYTRLHCKMSGDWQMILNDADCYNEMISAFCEDVSTLLNIPSGYVLDIDACCGSLLIDFTVKHNGERDDECLQDLINGGCFSALSMFYEKVTFKKTSPLNTIQQQAAYDLEQRLAHPVPISGMGIKQTLEDYYYADGTLDEGFTNKVKAHPNYRPSVITIQLLREDYDERTVRGPFEQCAEDEAEVDLELAQASQCKAEDRSAGATQASAGLSDTADAAPDVTEPTLEMEVRDRNVTEDASQEVANNKATPTRGSSKVSSIAALSLSSSGSKRSSKASSKKPTS
ncbi:hypothetical protein LPMP_261920 [Leishmania panamensis]|uniref:Uncharacterized protein n=1 Tax=Leishmania panamensis TaxID=5679 RepID=A0A088RVL3_LEIPA|nr:hypothetical protein LPMP_261920 [Leishmania panamensis]AIN99304.1 hypothetical protein LPMP_261920 [Leishmania panamensis]